MNLRNLTVICKVSPTFVLKDFLKTQNSSTSPDAKIMKSESSTFYDNENLGLNPNFCDKLFEEIVNLKIPLLIITL